MAQIKTEQEYRKLMQRINELIEVVDDNTPKSDINYIELDVISDLVEEYEEAHYPIGKPSLIDTLRLRMYEMGLTQTNLSALLGVSPSRISEILSGKSEPTLQLGREISRKLNIDANVVLGV